MLIEQLKNKTAKQKAQIKSKELAKVKIGKFKKDDLNIEIIGDIKAIEINGSHGIEFFAKASKNNKQLGFSKDGSVEIERLRIFNPPVLVDDENGDIIREWIDIDTKKLKQRKLKEDPIEAIKQSLIHTIGLVGKKNTNIVKGKIGNTTSTFYPVAGANSPVDGATRAAGSNWTTVRDATIGNYASAVALVYSHLNPDGADYNIWRGHILFDTSSIADTDTINSGTLSLYAYTISDDVNDAYSYTNVVNGTSLNSNSAIITEDYDTLTTTKSSDTNLDHGSVSAVAYSDFTLNANGLDNISKTGVSYFGAREGHDVANQSIAISPDRTTGIYWHAADSDGTVNDPKLVVVHEAGVTAPTVTTQAVTSIEEITAIGNGNITATGGENASAWGVCYKTTTGPTTADSTAAGSGSGGTGAFTASITGLTKNTKYYLKAYATNTAGTSYGSEVTFVTDNSGTWTGDSSLKKEISTTFTGDANLKKEISTIFTGDTNLKSTDITIAFVGDASLKSIESTTFTSNTNLKRTDIAAIFTGDSCLVSTITETFTSDSNLVSIQTTVFTSNTNLNKENISAIFTGDSAIITLHTITFTGDAIITPEGKTYSSYHTVSLPADDTNLSYLFIPLDYTNVLKDDSDYVGQAVNDTDYSIFQFKEKKLSQDSFRAKWIGQSTLAPSISEISLQVYNRTSGLWETLDSDSITAADIDFTLQEEQSTNLNNYYDVDNWLSFRVIQQNS